MYLRVRDDCNIGCQGLKCIRLQPSDGGFLSSYDAFDTDTAWAACAVNQKEKVYGVDFQYLTFFLLTRMKHISFYIRPIGSTFET